MSTKELTKDSVVVDFEKDNNIYYSNDGINYLKVEGNLNISENKVLYVLKWIDKENKVLPVFYPVFDLKENKKLTENDIINNSRYVPGSDVLRMQEIITRSNEIMEERAKGE